MGKIFALMISLPTLLLIIGIAYAQMSYCAILEEQIGQYPKSNIMMSNDLGEELQIVMTSNDAVKNIAKYYKDGLKDNGWKIEGIVVAGPSVAL